jgi:hypothetical protein
MTNRSGGEGEYPTPVFEIKSAEMGCDEIMPKTFGGHIFYVEHSVNREPAEFDGLRRFEDGKKAEKGLRPSGDRPVELGFSFVCNKTITPRVGYVV